MAVISDSNVDPIYGAKVEALLAPVAHQVVRIVVPAGEASKCWQQLDAIHDRMLEARLDRKSLIVALGGGVVGDLAGFAAASFQRGIDFVQVPTSLLAQVDSSVGGKTGINHARGKNMVGAFHQPRLVVADTGTLKTLPSRELAAGLAEVIKHGAIADRAYLEQVAVDMPALLAASPRRWRAPSWSPCASRRPWWLPTSARPACGHISTLATPSAMPLRSAPAMASGCTARPLRPAW